MIILSTSIIYLVGFKVTVSELSDVSPDKDIKLELEKAYDRFECGMLDIPDKFQEEIILYKWAADAVEQYLAEKGIEDTISNVMAGIYTCRVRGKEHTLYIDAANMKCHVYEVED